MGRDYAPGSGAALPTIRAAPRRRCMTTPRLSVTLITKNEAHNIEDCLRSVQGLADEIVVLDSGSSDGTVEIAQRLGYTSHPGMQDVERFMKHYFLIAKDVGDVVDDAHPVAEPVGPAERQRIVDGRQAERLTGMNGEVSVVVPHVFEGVQMPGGWVSGLRAGDVEADHAVVPVAHGGPGGVRRCG